MRYEFGAAFPRPQRTELPDYLKFVRRHSCCVKNCWKRTEAHHVVFDGQGKIGSKVSDTQAISLCEKHHQEYHAIGRDAFELKHGLNCAQIIIQLLTEYILEKSEAKIR